MPTEQNRVHPASVFPLEPAVFLPSGQLLVAVPFENGKAITRLRTVTPEGELLNENSDFPPIITDANNLPDDSGVSGEIAQIEWLNDLIVVFIKVRGKISEIKQYNLERNLQKYKKFSDGNGIDIDNSPGARFDIKILKHFLKVKPAPAAQTEVKDVSSEIPAGDQIVSCSSGYHPMPAGQPGFFAQTGFPPLVYLPFPPLTAQLPVLPRETEKPGFKVSILCHQSSRVSLYDPAGSHVCTFPGVYAVSAILPQVNPEYRGCRLVLGTREGELQFYTGEYERQPDGTRNIAVRKTTCVADVRLSDIHTLIPLSDKHFVVAGDTSVVIYKVDTSIDDPDRRRLVPLWLHALKNENFIITPEDVIAINRGTEVDLVVREREMRPREEDNIWKVNIFISTFFAAEEKTEEKQPGSTVEIAGEGKRFFLSRAGLHYMLPRCEQNVPPVLLAPPVLPVFPGPVLVAQFPFFYPQPVRLFDSVPGQDRPEVSPEVSPETIDLQNDEERAETAKRAMPQEDGDRAFKNTRISLESHSQSDSPKRDEDEKGDEDNEEYFRRLMEMGYRS